MACHVFCREIVAEKLSPGSVSHRALSSWESIFSEVPGTLQRWAWNAEQIWPWSGSRVVLVFSDGSWYGAWPRSGVISVRYKTDKSLIWRQLIGCLGDLGQSRCVLCHLCASPQSCRLPSMGDVGITQSSGHAGIQGKVQWAQWEEDGNTDLFPSSSGFTLSVVWNIFIPFRLKTQNNTKSSHKTVLSRCSFPALSMQQNKHIFIPSFTAKLLLYIC